MQENKVNNLKINNDVLRSDFFVNFVTSDTNVQPYTPVLVGRAAYLMESMVFFPTTRKDIVSAFTNMKDSGAHDKNHFHICPIKFVIDFIAPLLAHIYNLALDFGIFTKKMHIAK